MLGLGLSIARLARAIVSFVLDYPTQETGDRFTTESGTDTIKFE